MKVFISYAHEDKLFVQRLSEILKGQNIEVWLDDFELKVGDNIIDKINKGIDQCDYIIAVLSRAYTKSHWGLKELNAFAIRELSSETNQILPILIEDCEIPIFLRDRVYL